MSTAGSSRFVFDREILGDWAKARIPHVESWGEWYQAIGHERHGDLVASVIYNHYSGHDISMHVAAEGFWATHEFLRTCFLYPFCQLGVNRVTGYVPAKNERALRLNRHLGFKREGLLREALPDDDIVVLGMLKRECKWVNQADRRPRPIRDK